METQNTSTLQQEYYKGTRQPHTSLSSVQTKCLEHRSRSNERGSGISVLVAQHDDDDDLLPYKNINNKKKRIYQSIPISKLKNSRINSHETYSFNRLIRYFFFFLSFQLHWLEINICCSKIYVKYLFKNLYPVLCAMAWRPMPAAARSKLCRSVSAWLGVAYKILVIFKQGKT